MRHSFVWLLVALMALSGCSLGLRQQWTDFNAYFNTFYNANQGYERGIRAMENQRATINAERPIRIHQIPVRAGQTEFERAIEKSADILRNHDESRWVDPALELIGKSYFHLSQFFSAEQKFNEILAASDNELSRQSAIYWRGRVYLETNRYNEGIRYLNGILLSEEFDWDGQIFRELHLVLAQLHVQLENWQEADEALRTGIAGFRDDVLRSRASFLHGQVLERMDMPEEAIAAYFGLSNRYPDYQLLYLSQLKRNQLLRETGEHQRAFRGFTRMMRDDKNFEHIAELNYEFGRTKQVMGQYDEAFATFDEVLYRSLQTPTRETIAKTHYAIAELYRFAYSDFRMAALYYDSSSRAATDLSRLPESFDARDLAESFGSYARLSLMVQEKDSLMWLGSLPQDEFETVIRKIRDERLREYERQMRLEQLRGTTVVTIAEPGNEQVSPELTRDNGFLNHRNEQLVRQASEGFAAMWESRPLVDNWRRMEGVRQAVIVASEPEEADSVAGGISTPGRNATRMPGIADLSIPPELQIDLSIIPFTDEDRQKMGEEIASLEYEIGNVFYLNLSMPDSALYRYLRVVEEFPEAEIRPQAMYSIADIYIALQEDEAARKWANAIIEEYPATVMARRISERLLIDADLSEVFISEDEVAERDYLSVLATLAESEPTDRIPRLIDFLQRFPEAPQRPNALLNTAISFAEIGRSEQNFARLFDRRMQLQAEWSTIADEFELERQKAQEMLADTTLSESDMDFWKSIADSTLSEPDFAEYFPYVGPVWDSTRVYLQKLADNHPQSSVRERGVAMLQTVQLPVSLRRLAEPEEARDSLDTALEIDDRLLASELDGQIVVDVGQASQDTIVTTRPELIVAVVPDSSSIALLSEGDAPSVDHPPTISIEESDTSLIVAAVDSVSAIETPDRVAEVSSEPQDTSVLTSERAPIRPPAQSFASLPFPEYPILGDRIGTQQPDEALLHWNNDHRYYMQVVITTFTGASIRRNFLTRQSDDSTLTLLPQYRADTRIRWLLGSGYYRDFSHGFQSIRATGADMSKQFIELYHYIDARLFGVEPDLDPDLPAFTIRLGQFEEQSEALRYLEAWKTVGMGYALIYKSKDNESSAQPYEIRTGKYTDRITAELLAEIVYQRTGIKADVVAHVSP
jgi:tetratricopeptide (TPR) repeat protein